MELMAGMVVGGLVGYAIRWRSQLKDITRMEQTAHAAVRTISALEADGERDRAALARLEGVNVGVQEFLRCLVRLDSGKFLASTVATRGHLTELEKQRRHFSSPAPLIDAARLAAEHAVVVCDSLDSARGTMADVRELLGQVAWKLVKGAEYA